MSIRFVFFTSTLRARATIKSKADIATPCQTSGFDRLREGFCIPRVAAKKGQIEHENLYVVPQLFWKYAEIMREDTQYGTF